MSRTVVARAPIRISFGGGGTDLEAYYGRFGGFVISAAISRYSYVVAAETPDRSIRLNSADYRIWESHPRGVIPPPAEPLALPKAALQWAAENGLDDTGVDLFLSAEVPPGTGLGSSSAMAVACLRALGVYLGRTLDADELAETACDLEIRRLDMPIGKQDQYASAFGGLNAITFRRDGITVRPLSLPADVTAALNSRLLLFSTGQSRNSAHILRQQRTDTTVKPAVTQSLHRIKALAYEMDDALHAQDLDRFGDLLHEAWEQKKRLSGKVSSDTIDTWYSAARAAGARGGKITGAGGGGFLLLYVPLERQDAVRDAMEGHGLSELRFDFDFEGAQVLRSPDEGRWSAAIRGRGWTAIRDEEDDHAL